MYDAVYCSNCNRSTIQHITTEGAQSGFTQIDDAVVSQCRCLDCGKTEPKYFTPKDWQAVLNFHKRFTVTIDPQTKLFA